MKESIAPMPRMYQFAVFTRTIDGLHASQIQATAEDYEECLSGDLSARTVGPNTDIQSILNFCEFLNSHEIPPGLSPVERGFYRRTAERMVRDGFLPGTVMQQFDQPEATEDVALPVSAFPVLCETI
jgi:hypothetical protein